MTRPTPDEAALLAAVWAAPHDDLPRLVYADWLDEHGRPERAEFIRLQIDRARREAAGEEVSDAAWRREEELCTAHGSEWVEEDGHSWSDDPPPSDCFQGGFFGATWMVTLEDRPDRERPPAGRPWLAKVVIDWSTPGGLAGIDIAAAVRGVREVELSADTPWTAADFAALSAAAPHLRDVTRLELNGEAGPELLPWAEQASFERVHRLELCSYRPGVDVVRALARSPLAGRLTELDLRGVHMPNDGLRAIGQSTEFTKLRTLRIGRGTMSERGFIRLLRSPIMAGLRELGTPGISRFGDAYYAALAAAPAAARLRVLEVRDRHRFSAESMRAIAASPYLTGVREVYVSPSVVPTSAETYLCKELFGDKLQPVDYWGRLRAAPAGD